MAELDDQQKKWLDQMIKKRGLNKLTFRLFCRPKRYGEEVC
jgi:hypothetical protein